MTETALVKPDIHITTTEAVGKAAGLTLHPVEVLENAKVAARALKDVLSTKPKKLILGGEQYLEYEDWQTVGQFYGYTVKTEDAVPVEVFGVPGAKAKAYLIEYHTGLIVGSAEAYCMRDEDKWSTRAKYEWQDGPHGRRRVKVGEEPVPWFQLASMAQTRAGAKAFRNRLAWVVVMAGFKPTPAEELEDMAEYGPETKPKAQPQKGKKDAQEVPPQEMTFKNPGEFYTACLKVFKLTKGKVDAEIAEFDLTKPEQRQRAWQTIVSVYGKQPSTEKPSEEPQEAPTEETAEGPPEEPKAEPETKE